MTGRTWMMLAACALAACSADEAPARRTADAAPDSAPAPAASAAPAAAPDGGAGQSIRIHPTLPPHAFALHQAQPGAVDSIVVSADGHHVQTLRPVENMVPDDAGLQRLSTIDLDYDGYADLALLSTLGMANSRSEYWRFDPGTRRFVHAGEMETLTPDSATREHTTFNRGGHAGRLWTAARMRWVNGALVTVAEEEQDALGDGDRYVHVVRRHQDGKMTEARRDTLEGAELRSTPTWMEP